MSKTTNDRHFVWWGTIDTRQSHISGPTKIRNEAKWSEMKRNEDEMKRNEYVMKRNEDKMKRNAAE